MHVLGSTGTTDSTTLGGATLPTRAGGNARAWYGVERISSLNGWSVGRGGLILGESDGGTSDGAVTWSAEMIGPPRTISDLFAAGFVDSLKRWRELGNDGNLGNDGILSRGDRGSAQTGWTILASHGAIFLNPSTARRIGSGALFSGSRDGGVRFSMQISDQSRDLFDAGSVYLGNSTIDFSPGRLEAAVEEEGNLINDSTARRGRVLTAWRGPGEQWLRKSFKFHSGTVFQKGEWCSGRALFRSLRERCWDFSDLRRWFWRADGGAEALRIEVEVLSQSRVVDLCVVTFVDGTWRRAGCRRCPPRRGIL